MYATNVVGLTQTNLLDLHRKQILKSRVTCPWNQSNMCKQLNIKNNPLVEVCIQTYADMLVPIERDLTHERLYLSEKR